MNFGDWLSLTTTFLFFPAVVVRYALPSSSLDYFMNDVIEGNYNKTDRVALSMLHYSTIGENNALALINNDTAAKDVAHSILMRTNPVSCLRKTYPAGLPLIGAAYVATLVLQRRSSQSWQFLNSHGFLNIIIFGLHIKDCGVFGENARTSQFYPKNIYDANNNKI